MTSVPFPVSSSRQSNFFRRALRFALLSFLRERLASSPRIIPNHITAKPIAAIATPIATKGGDPGFPETTANTDIAAT